MVLYLGLHGGGFQPPSHVLFILYGSGVGLLGFLASLNSITNLYGPLIIKAKGPAKILNPTNIKINISWLKIDFEYFPRIEMDALRPPMLLYALKTGIEIRSYLLFYKNKFRLKMEKWKLNSSSHVIASTFLHNMYRLVIFAQLDSQDT